MIHRDLKPSNVFFDSNHRLRVGDFGLATAYEQTSAPDEEGTDADTFVGNLTSKRKRHTKNAGTRLYMSPEQLAGQNYDHKVDIFSLGLIFTEMMLPFSTEMERVITLKNVAKQRLPLQLNKQHKDFIASLTALKASDRPDCSDILRNPIFHFEKTIASNLM